MEENEQRLGDGGAEPPPPPQPPEEASSGSDGEASRRRALLVPRVLQAPGNHPPHRITNFFIDNILRPEFGRKKDGGSGDNSPEPRRRRQQQPPPPPPQQQPPHLLGARSPSAAPAAGSLAEGGDGGSGDPKTGVPAKKGSDCGELVGTLKSGGGDLSLSSDSDSSQASSFPGGQPMLWPAWVYCTRYSDRPSSGKQRHWVYSSPAGTDERPEPKAEAQEKEGGWRRRWYSLSWTGRIWRRWNTPFPNGGRPEPKAPLANLQAALKSFCHRPPSTRESSRRWKCVQGGLWEKENRAENGRTVSEALPAPPPSSPAPLQLGSAPWSLALGCGRLAGPEARPLWAFAPFPFAGSSQGR